jgi:hypothetical protein
MMDAVRETQQDLREEAMLFGDTGTMSMDHSALVILHSS